MLQYNTLYTNDDIEGIAQEILNSEADVVAVHEMTEQRWSELAPMIAAHYPYNVHRLEHGSTDVRGFVFASPELQAIDYELGDGGGSDHRSLLARLRF